MSTAALTHFDRKLIALAADGYTNEEIATRIGRTRSTVAYHMKRVYGKVGIIIMSGYSGRIQLARYAIRNGIIQALFCLLVLASSTFAADHYVSVNGAPFNDGSIDHPWDFTSTLAQPAALKPGDTVWMRGGTYKNGGDGWYSDILGTATQPIIIRNYNGERVTIDGRGGEYALSFRKVDWKGAGYVWLWGIEVMDSNPTRSVTVPGSDAHSNSYGIAIYVPGVRIINCIVHDTTQGFSAYADAYDVEIVGNLSYYNGGMAPDRNHGHGLYLQNSQGYKLIQDNIVGDNADEGIQAYGSGAASIVNITLEGNALYNTSSWPYPYYQYNLVIGNGTNHDNKVLKNYSYFPVNQAPDNVKGYVNIGQYLGGFSYIAEDNVFVGQSSVAVEGMYGAFSFQRNKVVNLIGLRQVTFGQPRDHHDTSGFTWNANQYYGMDSFLLNSTYDHDADFNFSESGGRGGTFAEWKQSYGFDASSTLTSGLPTGKWIYVRPNKYERKRANVIIYNWDLSPTVAVDLSSVLTSGDAYVIQDAQNFFGAPVASGTYAGGTVNVPMTGLAKAEPIGFNKPAHTAPQFGTFIVMPVGPGIPIPQPTPTPGPGPTPPPTGTPPAGTAAFPLNAAVMVKAGNNLNVRSLPNASLPPIGSEVPGATGTVTSGATPAGGFTFLTVKFADVTGWVNQDFLVAAGTPVPSPVPSAPTLAAVPQSAHSVTLTWVASTSPVAVYVVYRAATSGGPYLAISGTPFAATTYTDSTVTPGGNYYYVVRANVAGVESANSNEAVAQVPAVSAKFAVGDSVKVTTPSAAVLNIRSLPDAGSTVSGTELPNASGQVVAGPTTAGTVTFWQVRFADGKTGWANELYISKATAIPPSTLHFTNCTATQNANGSWSLTCQ